MIFLGFKGLHTAGVQISGYLTGHRWGVPTVLKYKCTEFLKLNMECCVTDICQ
jgi:hypothetical protein